MVYSIRLLLSLVLLFTCFIYIGAHPIPPKVKRIVFIGNSITYAGKYVTDVEAYFVTRYPDRKFEFINVGLPSETVSGLSEEGHADGRFPRPDVHERLQRILGLTKPDLVFVNYGMNDGIYLPFDEERFTKFKEGIIWLHDEVVKYGAGIVHVTPPVYDEALGNAKGYAQVLDTYSTWLLQQQQTAQWQVADMHFPMKKHLEEERKTNPDFAFAKDAVHPNDAGHWVMAQQVLLYLGETNAGKFKSAEDAVSSIKNGAAIFKLVAERQQVMKDAWLTAIKHTRPEMAVGLPLKEALAKSKGIEKQITQLQKNK